METALVVGFACQCLQAGSSRTVQVEILAKALSTRMPIAPALRPGQIVHFATDFNPCDPYGQQPSFESHSLLKHSAGFILAAFIVWKPTVSQAINNATNPEPAKNHHSRSM